MRLHKQLISMELPEKAQICVSGCPNNCSEGYLRDIGFLGKKNGWGMIVGGTSGRRPRIGGDVIAESLTDDQAVELAQKCLAYYKNNARHRERTYRFIERIGIDAFNKPVLEADDV